MTGPADAAPPRTRADLLAEGAAALAAAGIDAAGREARLLLRAASGLEGAALSARLDAAPAPAEAARFSAGVAERARRRPLSQIVGWREFWGRRFRVTEAVLDPRPDSEALIAAALDGPAPGRVLDLGLGSGCLLLTLLAERSGATGLGVERSPAALAVARENAAALGVAARAELVEGDWWQGVHGRFDLVVCNPPYVTSAEWRALSPEVRAWEPTEALIPSDDPGDGLAAYRAVAAGLAAALSPRGRALLEVGAGQAGAVAALLEAAGLDVAALHEDMDGRARVVEARLPGG